MKKKEAIELLIIEGISEVDARNIVENYIKEKEREKKRERIKVILESIIIEEIETEKEVITKLEE